MTAVQQPTELPAPRTQTPKVLWLIFLLPVILLAVAVNSIVGFLSTIDDYYYLRSWDELDTSAFEEGIKGNFKRARKELDGARSKALRLSNPLPYLPIAENQLGENALARGNEAEARQFFTKALEHIQYGEIRQNGSQSTAPDMVNSWQKMIALNRLGILSMRENHNSAARKYFTESLKTIQFFEVAKYPPEEMLPFRFEKMRAVLALLEIAIEEKDLKEAESRFQEATLLDGDYVYDSHIRHRLQLCAIGLRKALTPEKTELAVGLSLPFDDELVAENPEKFAPIVTYLLATEIRTREDDYALTNAALQLVDVYLGVKGGFKRAIPLLLLLSQSSAVDSASSEQLNRISSKLDTYHMSQDAASMLKRCLRSVQIHNKGSAQEAELLMEIGIRVAKKDKAAGEQFLRRSYDIHRYRSQLTDQTMAASSRRLREVANALAKVQLEQGKTGDAISLLTPAIEAPTVDWLKIEAMWIKSIALVAQNRYDEARALRKQIVHLATVPRTSLMRAEACSWLARDYITQRDVQRADAFVRMGLQSCTGPERIALVDRVMESKLMLVHALCALERGRPENAERVFRNRLRILRTLSTLDPAGTNELSVRPMIKRITAALKAMEEEPRDNEKVRSAILSTED
jgi:tetratricopeptide (TPR) repeat protein